MWAWGWGGGGGGGVSLGGGVGSGVWGVGGVVLLDSPCHLVRPSACPSICLSVQLGWHGFRSVTQVCFRISISNFIYLYFVAMMDTSLWIFSDVTFNMLAWRWIWSPNWHITCMYGKDFQQCHFQNGRLAAILDYGVSGPFRWHGFQGVTQVWFGISISNFICMLFVAMDRSMLIFSNVTSKMAAWWSCWIFGFRTTTLFWLLISVAHHLCVYGKEPIDFQQCHFQNGRLAVILDFLASGP